MSFFFFLGDTNTIEKQTQQSDRSSNISDLKLDLRAGSSVSNMDYTTGATNIGRCGDSDAGKYPKNIPKYPKILAFKKMFSRLSKLSKLFYLLAKKYCFVTLQEVKQRMAQQEVFL